HVAVLTGHQHEERLFAARLREVRRRRILPEHGPPPWDVLDRNLVSVIVGRVRARSSVKTVAVRGIGRRRMEPAGPAYLPTTAPAAGADHALHPVRGFQVPLPQM